MQRNSNSKEQASNDNWPGSATRSGSPGVPKTVVVSVFSWPGKSFTSPVPKINPVSGKLRLGSVTTDEAPVKMAAHLGSPLKTAFLKITGAVVWSLIKSMSSETDGFSFIVNWFDWRNLFLIGSMRRSACVVEPLFVELSSTDCRFLKGNGLHSIDGIFIKETPTKAVENLFNFMLMTCLIFFWLKRRSCVNGRSLEFINSILSIPTFRQTNFINSQSFA